MSAEINSKQRKTHLRSNSLLVICWGVFAFMVPPFSLLLAIVIGVIVDRMYGVNLVYLLVLILLVESIYFILLLTRIVTTASGVVIYSDAELIIRQKDKEYIGEWYGIETLRYRWFGQRVLITTRSGKEFEIGAVSSNDFEQFAQQYYYHQEHQADASADEGVTG